jgi:uncharacterized linocin/CFP29 family protein
MNNLHRELAPVTDVAWQQIEEEARRTFTRDIAGRRVVDLTVADDSTVAAIGTGHLSDINLSEPTASGGIIARQRLSRPVVELRVPFTVTRAAVDDVERGSEDSDWQPVKDAARTIARAEDRTIFYGLDEAGIEGLVPTSSQPAEPLPSEARDIPDAVARAASALRLAGVDGPYSLLLSADLYTTVAQSSDHGYPIIDHLSRLLPDGKIIWAPALSGAVLLTERGGDYALHLGQDLSIGYLSHDGEDIQLYLQEALTFLPYTAEASVVLTQN